MQAFTSRRAATRTRRRFGRRSGSPTCSRPITARVNGCTRLAAPYVFIAEHSDPDHELDTHPILSVADATSFEPDHELEYARPFEPQHWGFVEALIKDADGRLVSLQAPVPDGEDAPDMDAHHKQKYG